MSPSKTSKTKKSTKQPQLKGEIPVPATAQTAPAKTASRQKTQTSTPASSHPKPKTQNPKPDPKRWAGLFILSLSLTMVILDNTILNIAIPTIVTEFGADISDLQWVISGYALVVASLLITFGRAGDIFGRRKLFMIGVVLFGLGSYLASISYTALDLLIGNSIIEGIGAAMMLPATLALISSTFSGRERAFAFAIWGAIAGAAGAFGPLLGGWLTTYHDWRWAFLINVVVAPIALVGAWLFLKDSREPQASRHFDIVGIITSSLGLFALVFALIEGQRFGWWNVEQRFTLGSWTWPFDISIVPVAAAMAVLLLGLFVWVERRQEQRGQTPLLELSLFNFKGFRYGLLTTLILSLGEFGLVFILPIFLQTARNYSAVDTGIALLPLGIAVIIGSGLAATLSKYIGPKWLITAGMVLEAVGIFTLSFVIHPTATTWTLAPGLVLYGLGIGLATTQLVGVILSEIPPAKSGVASGVNGTVRQVGTALGIAVIGTILTTQILTNLSSGISQSEVIPDQYKQQLEQGINWQQGAQSQTSQLEPKITSEINKIVSTSVSDAAIRATQFAGIMVLIGALVSLLLPDVKAQVESEALDY